jgi:hypothetical protein
MNDIRVAGESALTLLEAFHQFKWRKARNGMQTASVSLEPRLGRPLMRALMRVEAELLLEDADRSGQLGAEDRNYEQRTCDALLALALRVADALSDAQ